MKHYSVRQNIVLVGCGRIALKHTESLHRLGMLAGVFDIDQKKSRELANKFNVHQYQSVQEIIDDTTVNTVSICTPSGNHFSTSMQFLQAGFNVVVEKPMALRSYDAKQMIKVAQDKKLMLFVVKQNRFNAAIGRLREAFEKNEFGKPILATVRVRWSRPQKYYDQADWRGKYSTDGGIIANQASHHIDILQWFLGRATSVSALGSTSLVDIEAENTCAATIKFASGAIGIVEATGATVPFDLEGSFSLLGDQGSAIIGGYAMNKITNWHPKNEVSVDLDKYNTSPPNVYGFGHELFYKTVMQSLINGQYTNDAITGEDGLRSLELIEGIYESMHLQGPIDLPILNKKSLLGEKYDL